MDKEDLKESICYNCKELKESVEGCICPYAPHRMIDGEGYFYSSTPVLIRCIEFEPKQYIILN